MYKLEQEFSRAKNSNRNSKKGDKKNYSKRCKKKRATVPLHHDDSSSSKEKSRKKIHKVEEKTINHVANGYPMAEKKLPQERKPAKVNGKTFEKCTKPSNVSQQYTEQKISTVSNEDKKMKQNPEVQKTSCAGAQKSVIKRKNKHSTKTSKKFKKEHLPLSESDSDADNYIDKFFDELSDGEQPDLVVESGSSSADLDELSTETDSEPSEDQQGNAMSLEELLNFYGKFQDKQAKPNKSNLKSTGKQSVKAAKTEKVKNKFNPTVTNQWIEEDNDVGLVYGDSDEEHASSSKALVPVGDSLLETSEDDDDFVPGESLDDEEYLTSEDEMLSFEMEEDSESNEDSFSTEYSSFEDGSFSGSEDYDFEEEESSEEDDEDDEFSSYWSDSYNSEEDGDYLPSEDEDDLFIGRGTARIYEIDDNNISFNSDIESAQIVELPSDGDRKRSVATDSQSEADKEEDSELCPELVPIYDNRGRLIDSAETLKEDGNEKVPGGSAADFMKVEMNADMLDPDKDRDSSADGDENSEMTDSMSEQESDSELDESKLLNHQFYDSIDMLMSLLVLKSTLFFSGQLIVQPLVGSLEIMGYRLKPGECKHAFAARGFHSLNLTPLPSGDGSRNKSLHDVLQRLDKHFMEADLKVVSETFDPSNSVLVLLQSDCSNRRAAIVDKYMPELVLFPKAWSLQKGVFFTSEYLLNAQFLTEYVPKSTTLFESGPEWNQIPLEQSSRIVVIGGKGAGKSTLCQYLVNRAIGKFKKAVLIDLDIGQPIQHIPETISVTIVDQPLLGLACFNPIAPKKCWLFGSLDVVSSPIIYIQNVRQLIRYCHEHQAELANVPWIVNTMGYVSGLGDELMAAILRILAPSDVVQLVFTTKNPSTPNFQNSFTSDVINQYNFKILHTEVEEFCQEKVSFRHCQLNVDKSRRGFTLAAPNRRKLMLLVHLAGIMDDCPSGWFNEVRPLCAPLDQLQVLITREDQSLPEQYLPAVLNASLVFLCRKTDTGSLYECLGLGIVRAVDKDKNVFLLPSLASPEQLAEVTVLAICSSSLPNAILLRQSPRVQGIVPYVHNVG